ncbi:MAG: hypothetical protein ACTSX9_04555 [Candidatus Njordarchaeales archaeon]
MARERIVVKIALHKLQRMLRKMLRGSIIDLQPYRNEASNITFYAFCLKFLRGISKINNILEEITRRLEKEQTYFVKRIADYKISMEEDITPELDGGIKNNPYPSMNVPISASLSVVVSDEPYYYNVIYPLARGLEALSISQFSCKEKVKENVGVLMNLVKNSESLNSSQKFVPIVQALIKAYNVLDNDEAKTKVRRLLMDSILKHVLVDDPNLEDIYSQDIYFLIKTTFERNRISNQDKAVLISDLNSNVFRKLLKGLEYLALLKIDPPADGLNKVIRLLPDYFSTIFKVRYGIGGIVYFSSPAESIYNILQWFNDKTFASVVMSLLIGDTGWIARDENNFLDIFKTIVGSSLLIATRSALRR